MLLTVVECKFLITYQFLSDMHTYASVVKWLDINFFIFCIISIMNIMETSDHFLTFVCKSC